LILPIGKDVQIKVTIKSISSYFSSNSIVLIYLYLLASILANLSSILANLSSILANLSSILANLSSILANLSS